MIQHDRTMICNRCRRQIAVSCNPITDPRCYFCLSRDIDLYDDDESSPPAIPQPRFLDAVYPAIVAFEVISCIGFLIGWMLLADNAHWKPLSYVFLSGSVFTAISLVAQYLQHLSRKNHDDHRC